ncbi:MAG: histidine phosphatase family protein [Candidatus Woesebacteria bacterium]
MKKEQASTVVTFVRHGKTYHNELGRLQGSRINSELTDAGIKHAKEVACSMYKRLYQEQVKGLIDDISAVAILASDLVRCVDTAIIIAIQLKQAKEAVVECSDLRERDYGEFSDMPTATFFDDWIATRANDEQTDPRVLIWDTEFGDVETYASMAERVFNFFEMLENEYEGHRVIAVSHGAYIHMLLLLLEAETEESLDARDIYNMAQIDVKIDDKVELVREKDGQMKLYGVHFVRAHDLRKPGLQ